MWTRPPRRRELRKYCDVGHFFDLYIIFRSILSKIGNIAVGGAGIRNALWNGFKCPPRSDYGNTVPRRSSPRPPKSHPKSISDLIYRNDSL